MMGVAFRSLRLIAVLSPPDNEKWDKDARTDFAPVNGDFGRSQFLFLTAVALPGKLTSACMNFVRWLARARPWSLVGLRAYARHVVRRCLAAGTDLKRRSARADHSPFRFRTFCRPGFPGLWTPP